jgi:hypothetical protein
MPDLPIGGDAGCMKPFHAGHFANPTEIRTMNRISCRIFAGKSPFSAKYQMRDA